MDTRDLRTWKADDNVHLSLDSCGLPRYMGKIIEDAVKPLTTFGKFSILAKLGKVFFLRAT